MSDLRRKLFLVIFEADTSAGKAFDLALLMAILASVLAVILESLSSVGPEAAATLRTLEWVFTGLFTVEYGLRLYCVDSPSRYARSFFGIVDLVSILPAYLGLLFVGGQTLLVIRCLRLLRVFRILKLTHFLGEAQHLRSALMASVPKIVVFVGFVLSAVVILGSAMYLIEGGPGSKFESIPDGMWWAIVTLTTVGYGDMTPVTAGGKFLASGLMVLGYGIIAVPTGIVTAEMIGHSRRSLAVRTCRNCLHADHDRAASHCCRCGTPL